MEGTLDSHMGLKVLQKIEMFEVVSTANGPAVRLEEDYADEDGTPMRIVGTIDLRAFGSWSELLGIDDPVEILAAMYLSRENGEPEPDPETGENIWTDAFTLLAKREQEREQTAYEALEQGSADDPRTPLLRSSLAAHNSVHVPIDGGECVLDRCRRSLREKIGMTAEPSRKCTATTRNLTRQVHMTRLDVFEDIPLGQEIQNTLVENIEYIEFARRDFLHGLSGFEINPLRDTVPPEAPVDVEEADPFAATLRKYGG